MTFVRLPARLLAALLLCAGGLLALPAAASEPCHGADAAHAGHATTAQADIAAPVAAPSSSAPVVAVDAPADLAVALPVGHAGHDGDCCTGGEGGCHCAHAAAAGLQSLPQLLPDDASGIVVLKLEARASAPPDRITEPPRHTAST